jgi:signal transduction histidine kinase
MYSLRRVLAVRFSLTLFLALGVIALWAMLGVRNTLRDQIDRALASTLALQTARLAAGSHIPQQPGALDFRKYFEDGSRLVLIRRTDGSVVEASASNLVNFPTDTAAVVAAASGRTTSADENWNDHAVRTVYAPAPAGSPSGSAVIEVAASLQPLLETNRQLLFAMLGTVLLGTIAVILGSYWLAGSAVAPVLEVAAQANAMMPGGPIKRITAHTDVTEYESLIEVLNGLLERCDRAFRNQRRLTADLGHELRTPLTALQGEFEVALRSDRTPAEYQRVLRSGLEEIDRLSRMCEALLLITRVESEALQREPTDVNEILLRSLFRVRRDLERRRQVATTRLSYSGHPPLLDPRLVAKLMDELLENAVKFSPEGSTIQAGSDPIPQGVRLWVEDAGPGIAPEHFQHLFEPFFLADEARTRTEGTGLGLSTAASIAKAHGGAIRASNLSAGGARFEVDFPTVTAHESVPIMRAALSSSSGNGDHAGDAAQT